MGMKGAWAIAALITAIAAASALSTLCAGIAQGCTPHIVFGATLLVVDVAVLVFDLINLKGAE